MDSLKWSESHHPASSTDKLLQFFFYFFGLNDLSSICLIVVKFATTSKAAILGLSAVIEID